MGDLPDWVTQVTVGSDVVLFSGVVVAGSSTAMIDVTGYDSLEVTNNQLVSVNAMALTVKWYDVNGLETVDDSVTAYASAVGAILSPLLVPVRGVKCAIFNSAGPDQTVTVYGSRRSMPAALGAGYASMRAFTTGAQVMVANTPYPLAPDPVGMQGQCQMGVTFGGTTALGELTAQGVDVAGAVVAVPIATTGEANTVNANRFVSKQILLPLSAVKLIFTCRVAGTMTVNVALIGLGG